MLYFPSIDDLREARERIKPFVRPTPLLRLETLDRNNNRVFLKLENLQRTGSFKVRGAFNALASMESNVRANGVIAFSSGNHGTAVAFAAREMGITDRGSAYPCIVVMPEGANPVKAAAIEACGAEIIYFGSTVEDRQRRAVELGREKGMEVLPSYDDARIICGQSSIGLELLDQWMSHSARGRRIGLLAAPVGGGGLMAGISAALRCKGFSGRIIGVEPADANDTALSFQAGERIHIALSQTVCDGLRSTAPGEMTFPILKQNVDGIALATEAQVIRTAQLFLRKEKLLVEPSGIVPIAAWSNGAMDGWIAEPESDIVLVISGGNVDPKKLLELAAH